MDWLIVDAIAVRGGSQGLRVQVQAAGAEERMRIGLTIPRVIRQIVKQIIIAKKVESSAACSTL